MIQIPAILREIASSGGSLYEKGPPSIAVLQMHAGCPRQHFITKEKYMNKYGME